MAAPKDPPVEKTMIMSLAELERIRELQRLKKLGLPAPEEKSEKFLPPPDASHQKTTVAAALEPEIPSVEVSMEAYEPEAFAATRLAQRHLVEPAPLGLEMSQATMAELPVIAEPLPPPVATPPGGPSPTPVVARMIADAPAPEVAPPPSPTPVRAAAPRAPAAAPAPRPPPATTLLEQFTPEVVRATPLDPAAVYEASQEVHRLHAFLEDGQGQGDMLVWREGALIGAERFVKGTVRERLMFHPDGSWARYYLFDAFGLPRYEGLQKGSSGDSEAFPSGPGIHPDTLRVEYLYDDHGGLEASRCLDEYGDELSREVISRAADEQTEQTVFGSLEEASQRWRAEGAQFKDALNAWFQDRYAQAARGEEADWSVGEPRDPRGDMERVAVQAIEQYNAEGRFDELRADFPPAFEPFTGAFWERFAMPVEQVVSLPGGGLLIAADRQCYHALDNSVTELEGVVAFGRCPAHRFVALARADAIEVRDGLEGPVVASFAYPTSYGWLSERFPGRSWENLGRPETMRVTRLHVHPDGKGVVLVSAEGIYALSAEGSTLLYPQPRQLKGYFEKWKTLVQQDGVAPSLELSFAFAELSSDGALLACGARLVRGVLAQLEIFRWEEVEWVPHVSSFEKAMFPRLLRFHDTSEQVAFAPVLYATVDTTWSDSMPNTVFRFSRARLDAPGKLEAFDGGLRVAPGIVNAIEPWGPGFVLGLRDQGYLWLMSAEADEVQLGFMRVGGSIEALERSADGAHLYVGTSSGQVLCLRADEGPDPQLISDLPLTDEKRYLFWRSFSPMVW